LSVVSSDIALAKSENSGKRTQMNEKKRRREAADSGTVSGNISGFCRFHEADFKDSPLSPPITFSPLS
jgi:hypothetical protein